MSLPLALLAILSLCILVVPRIIRHRRQKLPYPPGPPADPILGHLRFIPTNDAYETFHEWSKQYGDVMYLEVLGKPIVVLSSEEAASDLLERRGANYSDRPAFPIYERCVPTMPGLPSNITNYRIGWRDMLVFIPYGPYYRKMRKLLRDPLLQSAIPNYKHILDRESLVFLKDLLQSPEDVEQHALRYATLLLTRRSQWTLE